MKKGIDDGYLKKAGWWIFLYYIVYPITAETKDVRCDIEAYGRFKIHESVILFALFTISVKD